MLSLLVCRNKLHKKNFLEIASLKQPGKYYVPQIVVRLVRMAYFRFYKPRLVEMEKTARPLETNAHANFPKTENAAYQCIENGGGETCPH